MTALGAAVLAAVRTRLDGVVRLACAPPGRAYLHAVHAGRRTPQACCGLGAGTSAAGGPIMSDIDQNEIQSQAARARNWLFEQCFPLWATNGVHPAGGFHETLDFEGQPHGSGETRVRVQARQTYVFSQALRLGWEPETRHASWSRWGPHCWKVLPFAMTVLRAEG